MGSLVNTEKPYSDTLGNLGAAFKALRANTFAERMRSYEVLSDLETLCGSRELFDLVCRQEADIAPQTARNYVAVWRGYSLVTKHDAFHPVAEAVSPVLSRMTNEFYKGVYKLTLQKRKSRGGTLDEHVREIIRLALVPPPPIATDDAIEAAIEVGCARLTRTMDELLGGISHDTKVLSLRSLAQAMLDNPEIYALLTQLKHELHGGISLRCNKATLRVV